MGFIEVVAQNEDYLIVKKDDKLFRISISDGHGEEILLEEVTHE